MSGYDPTRYAERDARFIAYRTSSGDGRFVIAQMPAFYPMSAVDDPHAKAWYRRIGSMGRTVIFDRSGVGESDPLDLADPPTLDDLADDTVAVMDAVGADDAVVFAYWDVVPVAIRTAVRHPDRVSSLVLVQGFVSWKPRDDLADGMSSVYDLSYEAAVQDGVDSGLDILALVAPSAVHDPEFRQWFDALGRRGASPRSALVITNQQRDWDVRGDLAHVRCPALVAHRTANPFVPVEQSRYMARHIARARLVEAPGSDTVPFTGDHDQLLGPIEEFVAGRRGEPGQRSLAAVLFTDIVDSTRIAAEQGDRAWQRLLEQHDAAASILVSDHGGTLVKLTGDGVLAVFTSAASAVSCATMLRDRIESLGLGIRVGLHIGEVERHGEDVTGLAVNIAARVMAKAHAGEVWVSGAVPPLMAGSGVEFEDRGSHELKGVPGDWQLLIAQV